MKHIDISILRLSDTIENSLNDSLTLFQQISNSYFEELSNSPLMINLLDDAMRSERLKETAHSRILYRILHDKNMQKRFVEYLLPNVNFTVESIHIPYPDKHRIDLTIKSDKFFLIIENKINNAPEQTTQIDRYVKYAQKTYSDAQIYVLYLGGETNVCPSRKSLSEDIRNLLGDRLILKNYKDDITPWIASVYRQIDFNVQPFLKSTLLIYKTYLENKYNINEMNHKIDKTLIETLGLDFLQLEEKTRVIEDQITNLNKILERLTYLNETYKEQIRVQNIKEWNKLCSKKIGGKIVLTMENNMEFGFNFMYRNREFRCCVSYDNNCEDPYWGIQGRTVNANSCPKIFDSLKKFILHSNMGFHDYEYNDAEWVISDYEMNDLIVDRFITLTHLIYNSESCSVN